MQTRFTIAEARTLLPAVRTHVDEMVEVRADLAEAQAALQRGEEPRVGGLPEVKALEARLQEAVDWFTEQGIQVKGLAPLIIDFPSEIDGEPALLCWVEGERSLDWYHHPDLGFMGRRRLPDAG